jgi:hypothetical protein
MKKLLLGCFVLVLSLCSTGVLFASEDAFPSVSEGTVVADTTGERMVITTNYNQTYVGIILSDDGREVLLDTEDRGKIYLSKSNILSIKPARATDVVSGEYVGEGAFTTRYSFTTNALPVKRGENYAMLNLYGPEVHFAVSDNTSLGIMSTWLGSPMALAVKRSFETADPLLNFSAGALLGTSGYLNDFVGRGGLYFANATYGNRKHNVTVALGYAQGSSRVDVLPSGNYVDNNPGFYIDEYLDSDVLIQDKSRFSGPLLSVAGITKVGPKASLVFDSMWGMFRSNRPNNTVETTTIQEPFYDPFTGMYIDGVYSHNVELVEGDGEPVFMFFLMPGFRVERTPNKSFQFNLAGVSFTLEGERISFPFPMCTWFYGF